MKALIMTTHSHQPRQTKIVVTLGPAFNSYDKID
jgi:pyruvate kinase